MRYRIRTSRLIVWPLAVGIILAGSQWEQQFVLRGLLLLIGCVFVSTAAIGRLWCSQYICAYKTKHLVTSGPYSLSRNPLYVFSSIGAVGLGFATETLTIPFVLALLFAVFYPKVIRDEETKLAELHGEPFKAYMASVPRFWPRNFKIVEPEEYIVSPVKFRHALLDAIWFVWILGIIQMAEALRNAGILPTLYKLY
jgi:protein-S-isoprenylcysteine O-methyltransferase Ste14